MKKGDDVMPEEDKVVTDENKHNIFYFEAKSMLKLFECLKGWQNENNKRFLSIAIQKVGDTFYCIALSNPSEVVITSKDGKHHADVTSYGCLNVVDTSLSEYFAKM